MHIEVYKPMFGCWWLEFLVQSKLIITFQMRFQTRSINANDRLTPELSGFLKYNKMYLYSRCCLIRKSVEIKMHICYWFGNPHKHKEFILLTTTIDHQKCISSIAGNFFFAKPLLHLYRSRKVPDTHIIFKHLAIQVFVGVDVGRWYFKWCGGNALYIYLCGTLCKLHVTATVCRLTTGKWGVSDLYVGLDNIYGRHTMFVGERQVNHEVFVQKHCARLVY